jgi:transcriptional regulator with GAF, ATPase, and Fis domain
MPEGRQVKLLRVLEQRQVRPVGSDREVALEVRIRAAANRELDAAVRQGTFRAHLYYRLNVMPVRVPPLRDHAEDIPLLADTFLQRHMATNELGPRRCTREALRGLEPDAWPGHVRKSPCDIPKTLALELHALPGRSPYGGDGSVVVCAPGAHVVAVTPGTLQ